MARTAVDYTPLAPNGHLADPDGTTIDAGLVSAGVTIETADPERTLLRVTNTAASAKTVTVASGTGHQSWMAGQGGLTVQVPAGETVWVGPFTSARFQVQGSRLHVDFEDGTTGDLTVFRLPKAF